MSAVNLKIPKECFNLLLWPTSKSERELQMPKKTEIVYKLNLRTSWRNLFSEEKKTRVHFNN